MRLMTRTSTEKGFQKHLSPCCAAQFYTSHQLRRRMIPMEMLGRRSGRVTQGSCASGKQAIETKHGIAQDHIGSIAPPTFLAPAIVFLVSVSVYVRCLHPGAAPADSSELAAAAHTLGAAHPPGAILFPPNCPQNISVFNSCSPPRCLTRFLCSPHQATPSSA